MARYCIAIMFIVKAGPLWDAVGLNRDLDGHQLGSLVIPRLDVLLFLFYMDDTLYVE